MFACDLDFCVPDNDGKIEGIDEDVYITGSAVVFWDAIALLERVGSVVGDPPPLGLGALTGCLVGFLVGL